MVWFQQLCFLRELGKQEKSLCLSPNNQCPISKSHHYSQHRCLASFLLGFQYMFLLQNSKWLAQLLCEEIILFRTGKLLTSLINAVLLLSLSSFSKTVSFCISNGEFQTACYHFKPLSFYYPNMDILSQHFMIQVMSRHQGEKHLIYPWSLI